MNKDEIIKMAWDSGAYTHRLTMWGFSLENLERFAKLVAAKAIEQRTWVGLTADEIEERQEEFEEIEDVPFSQNDWLWFYTRAIEQALKEKNT